MSIVFLLFSSNILNIVLYMIKTLFYHCLRLIKSQLIIVKSEPYSSEYWAFNNLFLAGFSKSLQTYSPTEVHMMSHNYWLIIIINLLSHC